MGDSIRYENRLKLLELEQAFLVSVSQEIMNHSRVPGAFLPLARMMPVGSSSFPSNNNGFINAHNAAHLLQYQVLPAPATTTTINNNNNPPIHLNNNHINHNTNLYSAPAAMADNNKSLFVPSIPPPGKETVSSSQQEQQAEVINNDSSALLLQQTKSEQDQVTKEKKTTKPLTNGESLLPNGIMGMTDFLAGFDNVNNNNNDISYSNDNKNLNASQTIKSSHNNNNSIWTATTIDNNCNPININDNNNDCCPTTQSFDDLHQLLGKEFPTNSIIPPLSNNAHNSKDESSSISTIIKPSLSNLNTGVVIGPASEAALLHFGPKSHHHPK